MTWNEKYGGFWYVSSYDAVEQVPRERDTFAQKSEPNAADGVNYQGEVGVNSRRKSYRDESQVYGVSHKLHAAAEPDEVAHPPDARSLTLNPQEMLTDGDRVGRRLCS